VTDWTKAVVAFPDPAEIADHAIAFARMMFAHTAFEREVGALQDVITKQPGFGERRANQWGTRERPARMVGLIEAHRGKDFPHNDAIVKLLTDAIGPCEQRHFLAHGTWWALNRRTAGMIVRGNARFAGPETPPEQREFSVSDIQAVADKLADIDAELYKLRRSIERA
jgi:hypothetical protein